jgi:hypothetical protein
MSRTYKRPRRAPRVQRGFAPIDRSPEPPPHVEEPSAAPTAPPASDAPRRVRLEETYLEFTEDNMPRRGESEWLWRWRRADEESSGWLLI